MARSARSHPVRTLMVLVGLIAVLYGAVAAGVQWDKAQWTPKLALDLEGGTEIVLSPQPVAGKTSVDPTAVDESVNIIRQRVNGSGISEAEVARQGQGADTKIIVDLPGKPDPTTVALVQQSAQLQFRAVLAAEQTAAAGAHRDGDADAVGVRLLQQPDQSPSASSSPKASSTAKASPSKSSNGMNIPEALQATPTPTARRGQDRHVGGGSTAAASPSPAASPSAKPTDASDPNWVTPQLQQQFDQTDCSNPDVAAEAARRGPGPEQAVHHLRRGRQREVHPRPRRARRHRRQGRHGRAGDQQPGLHRHRLAGQPELLRRRRGQVRQGHRAGWPPCDHRPDAQPLRDRARQPRRLGARRPTSAITGGHGRRSPATSPRPTARTWPTSSSTARCRCRSRSRPRTRSPRPWARTTSRTACSPASSAWSWSCSTRCCSTARSASSPSAAS